MKKEKMLSEQEIDALKQKLKHLAIIMDGNGRWATRSGKCRTEGHKVGSERLKEVVREAFNLGIKYVTLFGFSSENWSRPKTEVSTIFEIINYEFINYAEEFLKNKVKVIIIGDREALPSYLIKSINLLEKKTSENNDKVLIICLNYSGRAEIAGAINRAIESGCEKIDSLNPFLETKDLPDPDFLIRTGEELRLSNFLLYQIAYTELYFSKIMWPDFSVIDLHFALKDFINRDRRFGRV